MASNGHSQLFPDQFEVEVPPEWRIAVSSGGFLEVKDGVEKPFTGYIFAVDLLWQRSEDRSWKICRRYNDFREMHLALQEKFPSLSLPSLPPRVIIHNQKNFQRRQSQLEQYLQLLLQSEHRALRGSLLSWLHPRFKHDQYVVQRTLAENSTTLSQRLEGGGEVEGKTTRHRSHTHIYNFNDTSGVGEEEREGGERYEHKEGESSCNGGGGGRSDGSGEGEGVHRHRHGSVHQRGLSDEGALLSEDSTMWDTYLNGTKMINPLLLRRLAKSGCVQKCNRGRMWQVCLGCRKKQRSTPSEYKSLLDGYEKERETVRMKKIMKQVEKDIRRTTVNAFVNDDAKLESLRRILLAYSRRNVSVGYCQSMNSIAAALLMHMEEELAFWGLVTVVEELSPGYYTEHLVGYQVDERVLGDLLREKLPELGAIMTKWEFKLSWVTTQWFLGTFMNAVKLDPALRVLDCYFAEGVAALLRLGLAIFKICAPAMVSQDTAEEAMMQIRLFTQRMNEDDMNRAILIAYNDIGHLPEDHIHELQLQHTQDVLNEVKRRQKERESEVVKTERKLASLLRASLRLEMLHKDIFYTEPLTPLLAVYPLFGRVIAERKRSSSLPGVDSSLADVRREIEAAAMAAAPPLHPHSKAPLPTSNMNSRGNGSARRGSGSDGNGSTGSGGSGHEGGGGGAGGGDMGGSGGHGSSVTVPSSPHTKKQGRGHRKNRTITEGAAPKQGGNTFSLSHISEARADEDSLHAVWQEVHNTMETIRKLYDSQIMVEHQRSSFKDRDLILRPFTAPTSQLDVFDMGRLKARKEEIEKELSERKEKEKEREGREEGGSSSVRNTDAMDSNQEGSTKMRENGEKQPVRKSTKELELEVNRINLIFDILPMVEPGPFIFCFSFRKRIMNTLDEVAREMNELLPSAPLLDECLATIRDCINKLAERNVLLGKLSHKEAARIAGEKAALAASLGAQGILFATEGGFGLIGRSMAKLSLDDDYVQLRKKKFATIQDFRGGIKGGAEAFGRGIWGGVSGIFLQPIRGARARGVEGFFRGVGLGLAGIITKPIGGVVDLAAFTTEGLRSGAIYNGNDIRTLHARGKSHTFVREQIGQMLGKRGNSEIDVVNDEKGAIFDVESTFKPPRRLSV